MKKEVSSLFDFLNKSLTPYHAVSNIKSRLTEAGYTQLFESEQWRLAEGGKYFVIRDGSSIIAFENRGGSFMICASHSDSPAFRVKCESAGGAYLRLDTEKYGGMIHYSWMDRPLTVAGRVVVRTEGGLECRLADIGDGRVVIPSVAIHMRRDVNESCKLNPAQDMLPLSGLAKSGAALMERLAESAGCAASDILSHDLLLSCAEPAMAVGISDELILSPRLDDLGCVWASLEAFLDADAKATPVLAVFNNEEVGSGTKQGAASTFLYDTLRRICSGEEEYMRRVASSFMLSADNAHGVHPNHPELADKNNAPILGGGIVIKHNANQSYTTDAISDAVVKALCERGGIAHQSYYNRADIRGGSTLGCIASTGVSLCAADIGLPQLAMHSANETAAAADALDMLKLMTLFYSTDFSQKNGKILI